jgi:thiol-disulfide isomerase/thioredoxin
MKTIVLVLLGSLLLSSHGWLTDLDVAKKTAAEKHQLILLNFSGSDWCGPCIRLRKEIFENNIFISFADSNVVLINADFPRNKKNRLSDDQTNRNNAIADKYNPDGKFPYTLLLNANGKVVKEWDGFPNETPASFVAEIKSVCDANK